MTDIWEKFEELSEECYIDMSGLEENPGAWEDGFDAFRKAMDMLQKIKPEIRTLVDLEEETDWRYGLTEWLEDYFDIMDMRGQHERLGESVDYLMSVLNWEEDDELNLPFFKAQCMWKMGQDQDAYDYCREWNKKQPDNPLTVAAMIYACIHLKNYEEGKQYAESVIGEKTKCDEDNDVIFTAAAKLAEAMGDSKWKKSLEKRAQEYEELLEKEMMEEFEEFDDMEDFELPF